MCVGALPVPVVPSPKSHAYVSASFSGSDANQSKETGWPVPAVVSDTPVKMLGAWFAVWLETTHARVTLPEASVTVRVTTCAPAVV